MAAQSLSNQIRQQVSNVITASRKSPENPVVSRMSQIKQMPVKDRYSTMMRAAAALHRAGTDSNYSLSDAAKKDCAAAAMIIAEKRGVKPSDNGNYTADQVKEYLNPKEMLSNLTTLYINDARKEDNTEEPVVRQNIEQDINEVYKDSPQAAQPAIAIAKAAPSKLPDSIVLAMSDEEFQQYSLTQDESEQERLNEARTKAGDDGLGKDIDPDKDVVDYKGLRDDPDWGHKKDDDDFKIEQGDIIEYLMKDVILSSVAWAGNRVAGFAGTVSYELLSAGVKEIHPYGRKAKNKIVEGWSDLKQYIKDCFSGNDQNPENPQNSESPQNPTPPQSNREEVLRNLTGIFEQNTSAFKANIKAQQKILEGGPDIEKMQLLQHRVAKHFAVLGDDGILFEDGTTKPYAELCGSQMAPEALKKNLKNLQENFDEIQIKSMIRELGYENTPEKQKEVRDWYKKSTNAIENGVKNKNPNISLPKPENFVTAYENAKKNAQLQLEMHPYTRILQAQTELFAEHYGRHKLLEELRKNPENETFTDLQKAAKFIAEQKQEARVIFLTAEKARREGKTELNGQPLLSRESMIAEAEKLSNTSLTALEQNKTEPVKDSKLKPLLNQTKTTKEVEQSLYDAATQGSASEQYAAEMHNLDLAEKEQITRQDSINKNRKQITDLKKKLFQKTKNADGKGGVDIGKKYQQQGGRN